MHIIVALITVSFAVFYCERLRFLAGWRRPAGRTLVDEELHLGRLHLPPGWRPARGLNEGASLQAIHPLHGRHVIVISESLEDYALEVSVHEHARITLDLLSRGIRIMNICGPQFRLIGGSEVVQYEIDGFHDNTWVKYLHTTIAGRRAFHQIIAWATRSRYNRQVFELVLDGFSEEPGPDPVRWPAPVGDVESVTPPASSRIH